MITEESVQTDKQPTENAGGRWRTIQRETLERDFQDFIEHSSVEELWLMHEVFTTRNSAYTGDSYVVPIAAAFEVEIEKLDSEQSIVRCPSRLDRQVGRYAAYLESLQGADLANALGRGAFNDVDLLRIARGLKFVESTHIVAFAAEDEEPIAVQSISRYALLTSADPPMRVILGPDTTKEQAIEYLHLMLRAVSAKGLEVNEEKYVTPESSGGMAEAAKVVAIEAIDSHATALSRPEDTLIAELALYKAEHGYIPHEVVDSLADAFVKDLDAMRAYAEHAEAIRSAAVADFEKSAKLLKSIAQE